jgi:hypothetical protein
MKSFMPSEKDVKAVVSILEAVKGSPEQNESIKRFIESFNKMKEINTEIMKK